MEISSHKVKDTVLITTEIVASVAMVIMVARLVFGADALNTIRMRAAKDAERICMGQAKMWADLASEAQKLYDKGRVIA